MCHGSTLRDGDGRLDEVRAAELRTGVHYAYRSAGSDRPSRVEVLRAPMDGFVDVFIHVARGQRAHGDRRIQPGYTVSASCLHLIMSWEDWLESAEGVRDRALPSGSPELLPDGAFRARPDRVPDPNRELPASYLGPLSRPLATADDLPDYAAAQLETTPDALLRWCTGLPIGVVRDLSAAITSRGLTSPAGTAGAVFSRSGALLQAMLTGRDTGVVDWLPFVSGADADFCEAHIASNKSRPWQPQLQAEVIEQWAPSGVRSQPPGWLRAGVRTAEGTFHRPGCPQLRNQTAPLGTGPLWRVLLNGPHSCRTCDGGGLIAHPTLLAFVAASDAWHARGAAGVGERWQQEAFADAVRFAGAEQQRTGQTDLDAVGRIAEGICPPGDPENAHARELLTASYAWRQLPDRDKDRIIAMANRRLTEFAQTLPGCGAQTSAEPIEDRATAARRQRHRMQTLSAQAGVPEAVLASLLFPR